MFHNYFTVVSRVPSPHVETWIVAACWHVEKKKFCVKLISVIIICYVCSVRLLRSVTPLCGIVCSCLHFLIKSALLLVCIFYHSWWIKDEYKGLLRRRRRTETQLGLYGLSSDRHAGVKWLEAKQDRRQQHTKLAQISPHAVACSSLHAYVGSIRQFTSSVAYSTSKLKSYYRITQHIRLLAWRQNTSWTY